METAALSLKVTFNLRSATPNITILDNTDYLSFVSSETDLTGIFKITAGSGIVMYENTDYTDPDIIYSSKTKSGIILPLDSNNLVVNQNYNIFYQVFVNGEYHYKNFNLSFVYTRIISDITITADGYNSIFTSVDNTDYAGSYTLVGSTRTHTVTPPDGSSLNPTTSASATITYNPNIWSGTWEVEVSTNVEYLINNINVLDTIASGTLTSDVYKIDMSVIRDYISAYHATFITALETNFAEASRIQSNLVKIFGYVDCYDFAVLYSDYIEAYRNAALIMEIIDPTIIESEEIVPFVDPGGGGTPVTDDKWERSSGIIYPKVITDKLAIGAKTMLGAEKLRIDGAISTTAIYLTENDIEIGEDESHNLFFKDTISGTKTLAELIEGGWNPANKTLLESYTNSNTNISSAISAIHNSITIGTANGLTLSVQELSMALADSMTTGALSNTDWSDFNSKQDGDDTLTALAGLTITQGSLIYGTGADAFSVLAKGSAFQILRINSGATAPEWATLNITPAGTDTQVIYNDGGTSYAGSANLTFNGTQLYTLSLDTPTITFGNPSIGISVNSDNLVFQDITLGTTITLSKLTTPDWANITNAPSSDVADIDEAVSWRHEQNTDTGTTNPTFILDDGNNTGSLIIKLTTGGTDNSVTLQTSETTQDIILTLPDKTDTIACLGDIIAKAQTSTINYIPKWSVETGDAIVDGYEVITTMTYPYETTQIPASSAVRDYVEAYVSGIKKYPYTVVAATITAGDLATDFEDGDTIDDVVLATGNVILIKDQADSTENGLREVQASGTPTRIAEMTDPEDFQFLTCFISGGTVNSGSIWSCTSRVETVGLDPVIFGQFGASQIYSVGTGLQLIGLQFSINSSVVTLTDIQTLTNKTLTTPTISNFTNATHDHSNAAGGGTISFSDLASKPTILSGYGITDAYTETEINNFFAGNVAITGYSKTNWDSAYSSIHNPITIGASSTGILTLSTQVLDITESNDTHSGYLSSTKYIEFNAKQDALIPGYRIEIDGSNIINWIENKTYQVLTSSGNAVTWDILDGYNAKITMTEDTTLTIDNIEYGDSGTIIITQDGTGGWNIILPENSLKQGGATIPKDADSIIILAFTYNGTNYLWNISETYV